jgi:Mn-dependent DtxR family transcriptional regulator
MIHESGENYLETILLLKNRNGCVRSIDIANELGFSKPSISRAMGILKESGLISIDQGGWIDFTPEGLTQAESIYERHRMITTFLVDALDVDEKTAAADACRIEHIISQESFNKIKKFVEK